MRRYGFSILILAFCYSICMSGEVVSVVYGRIVKDSISFKPMINIPVKAFTAENNGGGTPLAAGTSATDSLGYFSVLLVSSVNTVLSQEDTIYLEYPQFHCAGTVKDFSGGVTVHDDNKKIKFYRCWIPPCLSKGDTSTKRKDETAGFYLNDGILGSQYFASMRYDSLIIPKGVTMDDCTGWVCIRIESPETDGITEYELKVQLDSNLSYIFNFYINWKSTTFRKDTQNDRKDLFRSAFFSAHQNKGTILADLYLHEPELISGQLLSLNGKILSTVSKYFSGSGRQTIRLAMPHSSGVYLLKIKDRTYDRVLPILIRE
jgi:hypothetical protein